MNFCLEFLLRQAGSILTAALLPFRKGGSEIGENDSKIFKRDTFIPKVNTMSAEMFSSLT